MQLIGLVFFVFHKLSPKSEQAEERLYLVAVDAIVAIVAIDAIVAIVAIDV